MMDVFDGHNDSLTSCYLPDKGIIREFLEKTNKGHIDLPRAKNGGLFGGIFSIFIPPPIDSAERDQFYGFIATKEGYHIKYRSALKQDYIEKSTNQVLDHISQIQKNSNNQLILIEDYDQLKDCRNHKNLGMVIHFEDAQVINAKLNNLESYHKMGLRSLGLVWSRPNKFGFGVPFIFPSSPDTGPGLTDLGKELIKSCNEMGILVDLSHMNLKGFMDASIVTDAPLIVSHTNIHTICPSSRNINDKQIDMIGESNGIIGICFGIFNLQPDGKPNTRSSIELIVDHIEYVVERIGVDYVGFGSDFDGATVSDQLKDVSGLSKLIGCLKSRGFSNNDIEKIAYKNWLRVIKESWH